MHRGYTKRWRKRWDKNYHHDPNLWLLMDFFIDHANYKDTEVYFPNVGTIPVKRGQRVFGTRKLAEFLRVARGVLRRKLKILESIGFLTLQTTHQYSIATVLNYDKYNPLKDEGDPPNDQEAAQGRPTDDPPTTTDNKDNKERKKKKEIYTPDFLNFWHAYPRKVAKAAAFKAWQKVNEKPDINFLIKTVGRQAQSEQWRQDGGKFIPHPSTWINQRRWEDEHESSTPPSGPEGDLEKWLRECDKNK
jgi:hypothetical protein